MISACQEVAELTLPSNEQIKGRFIRILAVIHISVTGYGGRGEAGCHGGCAAQSGGVAQERGCGVEDGFQGAVADTGRCRVGSGDGLAGGLAVTEFGEVVRLEEWEWRG